MCFIMSNLRAPMNRSIVPCVKPVGYPLKADQQNYSSRFVIFIFTLKNERVQNNKKQTKRREKKGKNSPALEDWSMIQLK